MNQERLTSFNKISFGSGQKQRHSNAVVQKSKDADQSVDNVRLINQRRSRSVLVKGTSCLRLLTKLISYNNLVFPVMPYNIADTLAPKIPLSQRVDSSLYSKRTRACCLQVV